MSDLLNKRIRYEKRGGRHGWTGTIKRVVPDLTVPGNARITVEYDNGTIQEYCREAVCTQLQPGAFFEHGYLRVIGEVHSDASRSPTHIVQGRKGGAQTYVFSEDEAHDLAKKKAQQSRSGQAYMVLKIASEYQRDEPPVTRRDF